MKPHLRSIPHRDIDFPVTAKDADGTLRSREAQAWDEYHQIAQTLTIRPHAGASGNFPAAHIIGSFSKLGFDSEFTRTLISLAAGAWESLGTVPDHVVGLHPHMRNDLDEVRRGLLIQADKKMASDSTPTFLTPQASYEIVQQAMDPANLYRVLDEITTPWIILPRAYNSLQHDHAHYLPAYLKMIDEETNEEALHIFTRIAVEFLANFCIRFADDIHIKNQVAQLVMAGYNAMYWKSLYSPPGGSKMCAFSNIFSPG